MLPAIRELSVLPEVHKFIPNEAQLMLLNQLVRCQYLTSIYLDNFNTDEVGIHSRESNVMNWLGALDRTMRDYDKETTEPNLTKERAWAIHYAKESITAVKRFQEEASKQTTSTLQEQAFKMSSFLNPRYRGRTNMSPSELRDFIAQIVEEHPSTMGCEIVVEPYTTVMDKFTEEDIEAMEPSEIALWRAQDLEAKQAYERRLKEAKSNAPIQKEINNYMDLTVSAGMNNFFKWWLQHRHEYPLLAEMARNFLAIPLALPRRQLVRRTRHLWQSNRQAMMGNVNLENLMFIQNTDLDLSTLSQNWELDEFVKVIIYGNNGGECYR